jgi:hypothetical protein
MVLLFVNSCKKENRTAEESRIENPTTQKLATWYDNNIKISEDNPFSTLKPIWGKVHVGKQGYQNV